MAQAQNTSVPALSLKPPNPHPNPDPRYAQLSEEEKQDWAWQYYGYPGLSSWLDSSKDFFLLRRFSALNARAQLYLQNEISQREESLEEWDQYTMQFPPGTGGAGSFKRNEASQITNARNRLLRESIPILRDYCAQQLVNAFGLIKAKPVASDVQYGNLESWFYDHPNAIDESEKHFLNPLRRTDLFPILATEVPRTLLGKFLETVRTSLRFRIAPRSHENAEGLEIGTSIFIVAIGLGLLFGPMWWLNFVAGDLYRLGIITGFVSVFATWLWMAAGPRAFEILAGTAAYAAVLMVFLQVQKEA